MYPGDIYIALCGWSELRQRYIQTNIFFIFVFKALSVLDIQILCFLHFYEMFIFSVCITKYFF